MQSDARSLKILEPSWMPKVRQSVLTLQPYAPGKPIAELTRETGITDVIKLASNENPLGPSPLAKRAVERSLNEMHLYPDARHHQLREGLANRIGCEPDHICIGNGSNEWIDLIIRIFTEPNQSIVAPEFSFIAYALCARLHGVEYHQAPLGPGFALDAQALINALRPNTKLVFLANPNNPTGTHMSLAQVGELARTLSEKQIILVLDSAYCEYTAHVGLHQPEQLLKSHSNILILKTFSKIYGLAALRVGYALGPKALISILDRCRQPFNVSSLALAGAQAALDDKDFVEKSVKVNKDGMDQLTAGLAAMGLAFAPSAGNFILVDLARPASVVYDALLKNGVIIRPVANYGLSNHIRVSVGLPKENQRFLEALKSVLFP
jgi:histidinol-phosphate aminotransferase